MKGKKWAIGLVLTALVCQIPAQAATKNVQYYSPKFYYNGIQKYLDNGIVVIDGVSYIPIRSFSNAVGVTIDWNHTNNILTVNGTTSHNLSTQMQLQAKDYEIASLKKELEMYKGYHSTNTSTGTTTTTNYTQTEGTDILGTELTATARALETSYSDYFEDIEFDISLRLSSNKLKVTLTYEDSDANRAFNRLSERKLKTFVEMICEDIRDRHDDIVIEGTIKYDDANSTKYYFDYSKKNRLDCGTSDHYESKDYDVTEEDVLDILDGLTTITIDDYDGPVKVTEMSADVSDAKERIKLKVSINLTEEIKIALNKNQGVDKDSDLKSYLKDYAKRIDRETDYEDIIIYMYSGSTQIAYYYYDEDKLYVYSI